MGRARRAEPPPIPAHLAATRAEWIGLAVLVLTNLMLSIDLSVLYLAMPTVSAALGASNIEMLWMIDIYGFVTACLLITMGGLGDRIGRRRLLMIGAVVFGVASLAAALSTSPAMLIAARAAMGVGAATVMPSGMALIATMFRHPAQRGIAISMWFSTFMVGMLVGPLLGGVLLGLFHWGSVFLINLPVIALLLVVSPRILPENRGEQRVPMDLASVALSMLSVLGVAFSLKEMAAVGPSATRVAVLAGAVVLGAAFVVRQRRLEHPLIDLRLFLIAPFVVSLVLGVMGGAVQGGSSYMVNLFVQLVHGKTPIAASVWLLPTMLAMIVGLMVGPTVAQRVRPGLVISVGLPIATVGYVVLATVDVDTPLAVTVIGYATVMFGVGIPMGLGTSIGLGSAGPERAAAASSLTQTCNELGVSLGIATLGALGSLVYRTGVQSGVPAGLSTADREAVGRSFEDASRTADGLPDVLADQVRDASQLAFTNGLNTVATVAAATMAVLAVLVGVMLRNVERLTPPGPSPEQIAELREYEAALARGEDVEPPNEWAIDPREGQPSADDGRPSATANLPMTARGE